MHACGMECSACCAFASVQMVKGQRSSLSVSIIWFSLFSLQLSLDGSNMSRREESRIASVRRHLSASPTSLPLTPTATISPPHHSRSYSVPTPQHPANSLRRQSEMIRPTVSQTDENRQTSIAATPMTVLEMAEESGKKTERNQTKSSRQIVSDLLQDSESESSTQSSTVHSATVTCSLSSGGRVPGHTPQEGYELRRLPASVSPCTLAAALSDIRQTPDSSVDGSGYSSPSASQPTGTTNSELPSPSAGVVAGDSSRGDNETTNSGSDWPHGEWVRWRGIGTVVWFCTYDWIHVHTQWFYLSKPHDFGMYCAIDWKCVGEMIAIVSENFYVEIQ